MTNFRIVHNKLPIRSTINNFNLILNYIYGLKIVTIISDLLIKFRYTLCIDLHVNFIGNRNNDKHPPITPTEKNRPNVHVLAYDILKKNGLPYRQI